MKEALVLISKLVHQLQKERGCIALLMSNQINTSEISHINELPPLDKQFADTDHACEMIQESSQLWQTDHNIGGIEKFKYHFSRLEQLKQHRKNAIDMRSDLEPTILLYSHELIAPLLEITVEQALFDTNNNSRKVSAYSSFIQWKERVGRERALGAIHLSRHKQSVEQFVLDLSRLIIEQANYEKTFIALADPSQRACLQLQGLSEYEKDVAALHATVNTSTKSDAAIPIEAEQWFSVLTRKMDLLHSVELQLLDGLAHTPEKLDINTQNKAQSKEANDSPQNYRHLITNMSLFSKISGDIIDNLLSNAKIRKYKKGQVLFRENEQPTRFYLIIKGWVKLYKSNASGEESILQMLSSGDSLLESTLFLNTPYLLNAQVAEPVSLLSFASSTVRQLIQQNNDLAMNVLTNMSQRSHVLIQQVKITRLKSAVERVGWFLLKTFMNQSNHYRFDRKCIKLPYDKATIASYLDMKPETFSRTLKQFKNQGYNIENNTIHLPDKSSLCSHCNLDIANECFRYKQASCSAK